MPIVSNTTIQNRTKQSRLIGQHVMPTFNIQNPQTQLFISKLLELQAPIEDILFSIGIELTKHIDNSAYHEFVAAYDHQLIPIRDVPCDERDLLGNAYQYLLPKSNRLAQGIYYTNSKMAKQLLAGFSFDNGETLFDPGCGSGSFLLNADVKSPEQLYGIDSDPISVMIATFNYFIKYPDGPAPHIYCADFFEWYKSNSDKRFSYIVENPPYGAELNTDHLPENHIQSGESFSYFIELSYNLLQQNGEARFLLPEAIINVKRHSDIRKYILEEMNMTSLTSYSTRFPGVLSPLVMLGFKRCKQAACITYSNGRETYEINKDVFRELKYNYFSALHQDDTAILNKVMKKHKHDLKDSVFALGVVTGNNKEKLFDYKVEGSEPIYSGKEVNKYKMSLPKNFIKYKREDMQQVAPEAYYRAPKKLVYKVISKNLLFALDDTQSLTINSANIVIPNVPTLSIESVLGLLNSNLYSYLNKKLFGEIKTSKLNLQNLPFPEFSASENGRLTRAVRNILSGKRTDDQEVQDFVNNYYGLSEKQVDYIASVT